MIIARKTRSVSFSYMYIFLLHIALDRSCGPRRSLCCSLRRSRSSYASSRARIAQMMEELVMS